MKTSGDRLRAMLQECHLTASDFAAHRKVTPQHVNNWFRRGVPLTRLHEIASLLCVEPQWLRTGEGPKYLTPDKLMQAPPAPRRAHWSDAVAHEDDDALLPLYQNVLGRLIALEGRTLRLPCKALTHLGVNPADAIIVNMPDDSMDERIPSGACVAVDRSTPEMLPGELHAVLLDGRLRIAQLSPRAKGGIRLRYHNHEAYPDQVLGSDALLDGSLKIVGWAFWWAALRPARPRLV